MKLLLRWLGTVLHWAMRWTWRLALIVVVVLAVLLWGARNGSVPAPDWLAGMVAEHLSTQSAALDLDAHIDSLALDLREGFVPVVVASGVVFRDPEQTDALSLDQLELVLSRDDLLQGRPRIKAVRASGLAVALSRDADGVLSLSLGNREVVTGALNPDAMLAEVRRLLDLPVFTGLQSLGVEEVGFTFADALRAEVLESRGGYLRLTLDGERLALDLDLGQVGDTDGGALAQLSSQSPAAGLEARLLLRGIVPAQLAGLAGQTPLSETLARFDAPVSLTLSGGTDGQGGMRAAIGELTVGEGRWMMPGRAEGLPLDWLRARLALSPDTAHLEVSDLDLSSPAVSLTGHADLYRIGDGPKGGPRFGAQVALTALAVDLPDLFDTPRRFDGVWATLAYARNDNVLRLSDLSIQMADLLISGDGRVSGLAGPDQKIALNLTVPDLQPRALLELWPLTVAKGGRKWVDLNLKSGHVHDVHAALRFDGTGRPDVALTFAFDKGQMTPTPRMPLITDASGHGEIAGDQFEVWVDGGTVTPEDGAPVALSGGRIVIAPLYSRARILSASFQADTDVTGALSLMGSPGFRNPNHPPPTAAPLLKAGDATGAVQVGIDLSLPLKRGLKMPDVSLAVDGTVRGFATDVLIGGRAVAADRLALNATPQALTLSGPMTVEGNPLAITYTRPFRQPDGTRAAAQVEAEGALTADLADTFGLKLPGNAARGAGTVYARVDLPEGAPPQLALDGDLQGLTISIPALGVRKSAGQAGTLTLAGYLGPEGVLETIRLRMPSLTLDARAPLRAGGGVGTVSLRQLKLGNWLDAAGRLSPSNGSGGMRVALTSGQVDLRRRPQGGGNGGATLSGLDLSLDAIHVTDTLVLRNAKGKLTGRAHGTLTGSLNGRVPVTVKLSASAKGTQIQINSNDSGQVLRAAQIEEGFRGGSLDLRLVPTGARGTYTGRLRVKNTALHDTSPAMRIVSALSVIGAFEQMSGSGISFTDIRSDFRLAPGRVEIAAGSAVGPSLGMSFEGIIDLAGKQLGLQGVVSPVYFLNQAGRFMTRRGEGLFGMTFTVWGTFDAPKVAANPLSMLAPGIIREIFRGAPPKVAQ
ncbi:AsmA-like C-terminal region-containing protein [Fluviibacterium sp. DFM31]|uniref:AsmA-like C-terminal region-containing protein n=1 Tax=Meridianimarinicoccus marinus TaxID=3231483 RepID=A0ABV3L4A9_9RHOB